MALRLQLRFGSPIRSPDGRRSGDGGGGSEQLALSDNAALPAKASRMSPTHRLHLVPKWKATPQLPPSPLPPALLS
ncbi:unnamed protein product [Boreogadus saida]